MLYLRAAMIMLSGTGAFLLAVYLLNSGLKRVATQKSGKLLVKVSNSKIKSFVAGVAVTAAVNSSTASTVMTVSLVNAGILTLSAAAGIIIGANVASSFTGIIIAAGSLEITLYFSAVSLIGAVLLLSKKPRLEAPGLALSGFGLMFAGLNLMNSAVAVVSGTTFFAQIFPVGGSPLLLIAIGALASALMQSSAAVNALILVLVVPFGSRGLNVVDAAYIILGTNVGTCITSVISGIGAQINARRAALLHLLFNVIGTMLFYIAFLFVSPTDLAALFTRLFGDNPKFQLAWFNLVQNLICAAILLPLSGLLVRLTHLLIRPDSRHSGAAVW